MELILSAVLVLGAIALVAALVLFGVSKKFAVEEDPRLGQVPTLDPPARRYSCVVAGTDVVTAHRNAPSAEKRDCCTDCSYA